MNELSSEIKECLVCGTIHKVKTVRTSKPDRYKDEFISYTGTFEYCENTGDIIETDAMKEENLDSIVQAYELKLSSN